MSKPPSPSGRTNLASCVVATVFLILLAMVIVIVYLTVFKPQDPKIAVTAVQVPSYSSANGTVNLTFSQYASVKNPNRGAFSHYDSSLQLLSSGRQVGFMFVPAGKIAAGRTEYLAATFKVQTLQLGLGGPNGLGLENGVGPTIEMETMMEIAGRVRVLHLFSHHVEARARCRVGIAVSDGSVLGFHC